MTQTKQSIFRSAAIDITKFLLAIFVVVWHQVVHERGVFIDGTTIYDSWIFSIFVIPLAAPVPFFILASGFLSNVKISNSYKSTFGYGIQVFLYWLVSLCLGAVLIFGAGLNYDFNSVIKFGGRDWWYIWAFLIVKSLSPILNMGLRNVKKWPTLFAILTLYILTKIFMQGGSLPFNASEVILLISLYLFGGWIAIFAMDFIASKTCKKLSLLIIIGFIAISFFLKLISFSTDEPIIDRTKLSDRTFIWAITYALSILVLAWNMKIRPNKLTELIKYTFMPIYLFHFYFEIMLNQFVWAKIGIFKTDIAYFELAIPIGLITWITTLTFATLVFYPVDKMNMLTMNWGQKIINKFNKNNTLN